MTLQVIITAIILFQFYLDHWLYSSISEASVLMAVLQKNSLFFFAALTFGVYLIHDNFFMRDIVWSYLQQIYEPSLFLIPLVFFYVIVVFLICSIIDYCQSLLFSIVSKRGAYRCWLKRIDENSGLILEHLYKKLR